MKFNEFQTLNREDQLAEAGRIAGVAPSVFDGMWRTESGRGAAMLSPKGAKGHFGLMDDTRATWEKRFGAAIDPMDFGHSIYTAAHTLKENLGRFKNLPDALRAYNGGWRPAKWGNKETAAYPGKVLGQTHDTEDAPAPADPEDAAAVSGVAGLGFVPTAASLWDRPASGPAATAAKTGGKFAKVQAAFDKVDALAVAGIAPSSTIADGQVDATIAEQDRKAKLAKDTSFLDASQAAANGLLFNQTLARVFRDDEPIDASFVPPEKEVNGNEWQMKQLRNAGSRKEFDRLLFEHQDEKDQNEIVFANGTAFGMAATLLADLPTAAVLGGVTSAGLRVAKVGSLALAAQGRKGAALVSSTAEGIAGNVAYTVMMEAMGVHQGAEQYAVAVAGGLLNPILTGRHIGTVADEANSFKAAMKVHQDAKIKQFALAEQASKNLGDSATPEALATEMSRIEAEGIRADMTSHTASVPESRKMRFGEQDEGAAEGATVHEFGDEGPPASALEREQLMSPDHARDVLGAEVAPRWESPAFKQGRILTAEQSPEFQGEVTAALNKELTWDQIKELPAGLHRTDSLTAAMWADAGFAKDVETLEAFAKQYLPGSKIVIGTGVQKGTNGGVITVGRTHVIALSTRKGGRMHTALHELGHAIYHQHAAGTPTELLGRMDGEWMKFMNDVRGGNAAAWEQRYAATSGRARSAAGKDADRAYDMSRDEFFAEQFVKHLHQRMAAGEFGKLPQGVIKNVLDGVRAVIDYVKELVQRGNLAPGKATDEFFSNILKGAGAKLSKADAAMPAELKMPTSDELIMSAEKRVKVPGKGAAKIVKDQEAFMNDPIARKHGLDLMPQGTAAERAEAKQTLAAYVRADAWDAANPVDENRLNTILKNTPFDPVSNVMLRSKNPVVRMVAMELLENGGGAGGRRSSAAIAKWMNERAIIGNVIVDLDDTFHAWHNKQPGASRMGEFLTDKKRVEFNRLIAEEIEQRRYPGAHVDLGDAVRQAADAVEGSFERARLLQTDAKTIGWGALPTTSRGYMPHRMRSDVVRSLTPAQKRAVHGALTDQFIEIDGFDMTFADQLASKYIDRVQHRALGGFDAPVGLHQTGAHDVVKEALEAMLPNSPDEVNLMLKKYVAGGAQHTKKRLNLDLRQSFPNGDGTSFRLMDLYDTDMLSLVRGQSQRVSGEAALARHGIMGKPGLDILRRAMGYGDAGSMATKEQLEAFDQVAAEFLGTPYGTQNKWVDRAMQANSAMSLGGMGFNQLGEIINLATTLGVKSAGSVVKDFGRLRAEILIMAKGGKVENGLLQHFEKFGGAEFGTDAYKMVFPMDMPDAPIHTMGADSISAGDKLLRGAGHVQSKLSLWRAITSVQQRGVAEQVVHSIAKALREGKGNVTLADMGITDDVLKRLQKDMPNMTRWNGDKLVEFDITKAVDVDAANQLTQAVHRGVSQIIQGTFIGESGKYVHNSYLRMLTQFRNFSLTAVDKQWNRQKANRGVAAALGMIVGAMSAAAPIYMVRTYLASVGREDQDEYLEKHLSFGAVARATTNYIAPSGLSGDFLDAFTSVTGTGEATGGRSGATTTMVGNLMAPALGKVDKIWGAVQNTKDGTDVMGLVKEGPLARLPFIIPAINALGN